MSSISAENVDKPVELIKPDSLPTEERKHIGKALEAVVDQSVLHSDLTHGIHGHSHLHFPFLKTLVPGLENLASKYHFGNYVMMRGTNQKFFESMPIYARQAVLIS